MLQGLEAWSSWRCLIALNLSLTGLHGSSMNNSNQENLHEWSNQSFGQSDILAFHCNVNFKTPLPKTRDEMTSQVIIRFDNLWKGIIKATAIMQ